MAFPMQPLNRQFPRTGNRITKRNLIHSPKGALVKPALNDPVYFQRYFMLDSLRERLESTASKIRALNKDLRKGRFGRKMLSDDLEDFKSNYAIYLCEVKRLSALNSLSKMK